MNTASLNALYTWFGSSDCLKVNGKGENLLMYAMLKHKKYNINLTEEEWLYLINNSPAEHRNKQSNTAFKLACLELAKNQGTEHPFFLSPNLLETLATKRNFSIEDFKKGTDFLAVFQLDASFEAVKNNIINRLPFHYVLDSWNNPNSPIKDYLEKNPYITKLKDYEIMLTHFLANPSVQKFNEILEITNEQERDVLITVLKKVPTTNRQGLTFFEQLWSQDKKCEYLSLLQKTLSGKWRGVIENQSPILLRKILEENIATNVEGRNLILNLIYQSYWQHNYSEKLYPASTSEENITPTESGQEKADRQLIMKKEVLNNYWKKNCQDIIFKQQVADFKFKLKEELNALLTPWLRENRHISVPTLEKERYYEEEKPLVQKAVSLVNDFSEKHMGSLVQYANEQYFLTYLIDLAVILKSTKSKIEYLKQRVLQPLEREAAIDLLSDPIFIRHSQTKFIYLPLLLNFQDMIRKDRVLQEKFLLEAALIPNKITLDERPKFKL